MSAPSTTTLTLADGVNFDLLNPRAEDVSFAVICEHLAKANRYCGATPGLVYSVAQHSVLCARAALIATGDHELAAYLLCHDMHEAYLGDDTTPKKRALAAVMSRFGILASSIGAAFNALTDKIDVVIHRRAGLVFPPSIEIKEGIKYWDRVLLATEWRDLMPFKPPYDFGVPTIPDVIVPHNDWRLAEAQMRYESTKLLPKVGFSL